MNKCRFLAISILWLGAVALRGAEEPAPEALRDLARLKQNSNPARLEALQNILRERGIACEVQSFDAPATPHGRTKGANLILTFGNGPREITLGAHYDALELKDGRLMDGMVDNGAAVIILVRVAEALKGKRLRHRVRIVLYDMEETGLHGSKAYVAAHRPNIAAAINLDVAGFGDAMALSAGKAAGTPMVHEAIMMTCTEELRVCLSFPNFPTSDDHSFKDANIPVVSIALAPKLNLHQFWQSSNRGDMSGMEEGFMPEAFKVIHTPEDNIGKIEPAALDLGYRILLGTVLKLDAALE
jgi:Zn-dependent M28 family amino/carboxypeptidase